MAILYFHKKNKQYVGTLDDLVLSYNSKLQVIQLSPSEVMTPEGHAQQTSSKITSAVIPSGR